VQIVIVDGGSTDQTAEVVAAAAAHFPRLKFLAQRQKGGVDQAILETVSQADGEYCWLFSSDDVLAPGALARLHVAIEAGGWDLALTGRTVCDRNLKPLWRQQVLAAAAPRTFDWSVPAQRADYFARVRTTLGLCSYLSNIIVRRDRWRAAGPVDAYIGSAWILAAKMYALGRAGMVVRVEPDPLILCRGGNDSFAGRGLVGRTALSLRGFREVAWGFFGRESMEAGHVGRALRQEYHFPLLLYRKLQISRLRDPRQAREFAELIRLHYARPVAADRVRLRIYRCTPVWVLAVLEALYLLLRPLCRRLERQP
jgi:abequosyltransferase